MDDKIIEVKGLSKSFNGIKVLQNIDFDLRRGEIHALVGENGAGKSTFIKMLSGAYSTEIGKIYVNGKEELISDVKKVKNLVSEPCIRKSIWFHISAYIKIFLLVLKLAIIFLACQTIVK